MPQIITSKPLLLAINCMEAAAKYSGIPRTSQKFTNMRREIERKICALFNEPNIGRMDKQSFVDVQIYKDSSGLKRLIIDNKRGYFDHIIDDGLKNN